MKRTKKLMMGRDIKPGMWVGDAYLLATTTDAYGRELAKVFVPRGAVIEERFFNRQFWVTTTTKEDRFYDSCPTVGLPYEKYLKYESLIARGPMRNF